MASPHAEAKGLSFHVFISSERPIVVPGDLPGRQRLAWIQIDNAFKYTQRYGTVEVRVVQLADQVQLMVTDTGIGISRRRSSLDLQQIFSSRPIAK
jgi:signal transduction histidine kinase